ncbi:MAG: 3-isopropylmalate dehydratase small subunit [Kiritimatiellae bacterium]|nr:3-isopropylmalate dehydratase small subunit [Kiritimatiellia bacterium]
MEPFLRHRGRIAALDRANVDTDQIIPKQFLKSIRRTGFGPALFFDWRYLPDGSPNPDFELNRPIFQGATILVVRNNFGCGSSREHAVWAIQQYGFRAVIAPWQLRDGERVAAFAEIFRNNATRNGLVTVELAEQEVETIFREVEARPGLEATVDLERLAVTLHTPVPVEFQFSMDPAARRTLLEGLDEIRQTLQYEEAIAAFERRHDVQMPVGRF